MLLKNSLAVFLLAFVLTPCLSQQGSKPNIIFILTDDLGWRDLGCYGNPFNETPNVDALAKSGIRFTQAYAASPVCSPSRAAMLTGKHPARLKITNFLVGERTDSASSVNPAQWQKFLPTTEVTLAEKLKKSGYATAMIGKWHLGGAEPQAPWSQGFDFTRMIGKNGLDYYNYGIVEGSYQKQFEDKGTHYLTDKLTDYALEFIDQKAKSETPFFLFLSYSAPHVLTVPRGDKLGKYLRKYEKFGGHYNPNYAAMLESVDDGVGAIIKNLKSKGLLDNTLIVFTSDNGGVGLAELGPTPTNSEPLRKWKGHVYEGGIRVPLIFSWPGQFQPGATANSYVMNTDFYNTFLDVLGQKIQPELDGPSYYSLLKNPAQSFERGAIFWHYPHFSNQMGRPAGAVREGDWKLVKSYETQAVELFNLKDDLSEQVDLARKNPKKAAEMEKLLLQKLADVQANMPVAKK